MYDLLLVWKRGTQNGFAVSWTSMDRTDSFGMPVYNRKVSNDVAYMKFIPAKRNFEGHMISSGRQNSSWLLFYPKTISQTIS
jgi:hypothetical protein